MVLLLPALVQWKISVRDNEQDRSLLGSKDDNSNSKNLNDAKASLLLR